MVEMIVDIFQIFCVVFATLIFAKVLKYWLSPAKIEQPKNEEGR